MTHLRRFKAWSGRLCLAILLLSASTLSPFIHAPECFAEGNNEAAGAAPQDDPAPVETLDPEATDYAAKYFAWNEQKIYEDAINLSNELREHMFKVALDLGNGDIDAGLKIYVKDVAAGSNIPKYSIAIAGIGRAEPTSIKGNHRNSASVIIPKIVLEPSGISVVVLPDDEIRYTSHYKKLEARIRTLSNNGKGRPIIAITFKTSTMNWIPSNGSFTSPATDPQPQLEFKDKPNSFIDRRISWFRANDFKPTPGATILTTASIVVQMATTAIFTGNFDFVTPINGFIVGYGIAFGLFNSFWNNVLAPADRNDPVSVRNAVIKRTLVQSLPFNYGISIIRAGGMAHLNIFLEPQMATALLLHASLITNSIVNNAIGDALQSLNDVRSDLGQSRGSFTVLGQEIKKNMAERQGMSLWRFGLKMPDTLHMDFNLGGFSIPAAAPFYLSYPIHQFLVLKYAEANEWRGAANLRKNWEKYWGRMINIFQDGVTTSYSAPPGSIEQFGIICGGATLACATGLGVATTNFADSAWEYGKENASRFWKSLRSTFIFKSLSCDQAASGRTAKEINQKPPIQ